MREGECFFTFSLVLAQFLKMVIFLIKKTKEKVLDRNHTPLRFGEFFDKRGILSETSGCVILWGKRKNDL